MLYTEDEGQDKSPGDLIACSTTRVGKRAPYSLSPECQAETHKTVEGPPEKAAACDDISMPKQPAATTVGMWNRHRHQPASRIHTRLYIRSRRPTVGWSRRSKMRWGCLPSLCFCLAPSCAHEENTWSQGPRRALSAYSSSVCREADARAPISRTKSSSNTSSISRVWKLPPDEVPRQWS